MMDYIYDVFISYKRHCEWTPWTRDHLYPLLDAYLAQDLGRAPVIFIDEQIDPGADWPNRLAGALGRARILLAVFSRDYFGSDWCIHELDLMHGRLCQPSNNRLIIPLIGHDGDLIPDEIARIHRFDLSEFRNTDIQRRTPFCEQLSEEVKKLTPHVATAIGSAPPFDSSWLSECRSRFDQVYQAHCVKGPRVPPATLTLKDMPYPKAPPRVEL